MGTEHAGGLTGRALAVAAGIALRLADALTDPAAFRWTLGRLGWDVAEPPAEYAALGRQARDIAATARSWTGPPPIDEVAGLIAGVVALGDGLAGLETTPPGVDAAAFRDDLVSALPDLLLAEALADLAPGVAELARAAGALVTEDVPAAGRRGAHPRTRLDTGALRALVSDPAAALVAATGWGAADAPAARLADLVVDALAGFGLPTGARGLRPDEMTALTGEEGTGGGSLHEVRLVESWGDDGLAVGLAAELVAGGSGGDSLVELRARWSAGLGGALDLGGGWTLEVAADADPADPPALRFTPAGVTGRPPAAGGAVVEATLRRRPEEPAILLGSAGGSRLEAPELAIGLALSADATPELRATIDLPGLALVLAAGDGDSFLSGILGEGGQRYAMPMELAYGTASGLAAGGPLGLALSLPLDLALGPITLERVDLSLGIDPGDPGVLAQGRVTVDLAGALTVLAARVEGIGVRMALTEGAATTTPGLELGFVPPTAIGLTLEGPAVSGGGFIAIDAVGGRYSGALGFDALTVGIDALVVVDTQLPSDPGGWALFASLSASFPGIPLGFGFTLSGVGGLLAVNRGLDGDALALGLRSGAIDSLLFPDDPVRDSAELIARIDDYFPILPGNVVFGPVAQIGWGAPTLITAELGVVLSLPEGVIAVMGAIEALLPTPEAPLLSIRMDVLGVVDVPAGTVSLVASLHDSHLLGTITLDGDMAMYLRATSDPYFLLSVGGYHPSFQPPSSLPAAFQDLRRMSAAITLSLTVGITLSGYFAVTSNTLQFGGAVKVEASVEFLLTTYTAAGWFDFDVLLVFSPFAIIADLSAGVSVSAGDRELFGVHLSVALEGPQPWLASGRAEFEFFGIGVDFAFDIGHHAVGAPPGRVDVLGQVVAALESPASWAAGGPAGPVADLSIVTAEGDGDENTLWIRPDHSVSARQSIAPLDHDLDLFGHLLPLAGQERLALEDAGALRPDGSPVALDWTAAAGWFAPSQFEALSSPERLARASFDEMTDGVAFADAGVVVSADPDLHCTSVTDAYEEVTWSAPTPRRTTALVPLDTSMRLAAATGAGVVSRRPPGAPALRVGVSAHTLVLTSDGGEAAGALAAAGLARGGVPQGDAMAALRARTAGDPRETARLAVVPASAATPRADA